MNPRAVAYTITAVLASFIVLAVFGAGMFYVCVFVALVVWLAVTIEQRDEALTDYVGEVFENAALKARVKGLEAECDALHQENCALHDELSEARLWAGDGPRLRVLPPVASDDDWFAQREAERESLR